MQLIVVIVKVMNSSIDFQQENLEEARKRLSLLGKYHLKTRLDIQAISAIHQHINSNFPLGFGVIYIILLFVMFCKILHFA